MTPADFKLTRTKKLILAGCTNVLLSCSCLVQGYLSVNFSDNYFRLAQRHPEVPRLTPAHLEAMQLFTQLAASEELRMDSMLEPGDIQMLNNHVSAPPAPQFPLSWVLHTVCALLVHSGYEHYSQCCLCEHPFRSVGGRGSVMTAQ